MAELHDIDNTVTHCEGCGSLTGNQWGLCTRCSAEEERDLDYGRGSVAWGKDW